MAHDRMARTAVSGADPNWFGSARPIGHAALVKLCPAWAVTVLPGARPEPGRAPIPLAPAPIDLTSIEDQLDRLTAK